MKTAYWKKACFCLSIFAWVIVATPLGFTEEAAYFDCGTTGDSNDSWEERFQRAVISFFCCKLHRCTGLCRHYIPLR